MVGLTRHWRTHLEKALEAEEATEKDFHIRQVLQSEQDAEDGPDSDEGS
ncbi:MULTISPECIES: hypothetical protein [Saliphagus]|uniref:Uncharacterized protein n=1 Tax=Saliphagus infecundisoli TaxID=1849069 RepID=A0ABD5QEF7_9EURY|nr:MULTISPECIES: hypothetical protein [Saliphagus]